MDPRIREVRTESEIHAPPEIVWDVLMDFYEYPRWSKFIERIDGNANVGGKLNVALRHHDGRGSQFECDIAVVEPLKEFRWVGKRGSLGRLWRGEHYFIIEPVSEGVTRLVHGEKLFGWLVPVFWEALNTENLQGFMLFNEAVKEEAENRSLVPKVKGADQKI